MRDATKSFLLIAVTALLPSCGNDAADQNVIITNGIPADADVEALPPDESSATPSGDLENGAVDEGGTAANSY